MRASEKIAAVESKAQFERTRFDGGVMAWRKFRGDAHVEGDDPGRDKLVLFHGGFGSWLHWLRNVDSLSRQFDVLVPDLPGLGDSDAPAAPISPESLGASVADGLAQLVPSGALHLVGFSFGGVIAGQVALKLQPRISSLTLVGASGMALPRHALRLVTRNGSMSAADRRAANTENLARLMISNPQKIDDVAIEIHHRNDAKARLKSRHMSYGDSLANALATLGEEGVQLNGIWGGYDVTAAPWIHLRRRMLEQHCRSAHFCVVEDAGHWVAYEASERVNQLLVNFLQGDVQ